MCNVQRSYGDLCGHLMCRWEIGLYGHRASFLQIRINSLLVASVLGAATISDVREYNQFSWIAMPEHRLISSDVNESHCVGSELKQ